MKVSIGKLNINVAQRARRAEAERFARKLSRRVQQRFSANVAAPTRGGRHEPHA